jgi:undecaprenyl-diphosphatase
VRASTARERAWQTAAWFFAGLVFVIGAGVALRVLSSGAQGWDARTVAAIARGRGPIAIGVAHVASWLGRTWTVLLLAGAVGWITRHGRRAWIPVAAVIAAIVVQNVIKEIVRRPRPDVVRLEHVTSWSFPSGHATQATALLVGSLVAAWPLLRSAVRRTIALAVVVAGCALVGGSRVVLGVHYPTDVAAGIVLGAMCVGCAALALPTQRSRG